MIVVTLRWGVRAYIYVVTIVSILGSVLHEARSHYHLCCVIKNRLHIERVFQLEEYVSRHLSSRKWGVTRFRQE